MNTSVESIKGRLIVSCQALPDEPLHSPYIMGKMALAVTQGGAAGIRCNGKEDILEIKKNTNLPLIGIVKRNYPDSPKYITPTMAEINELVEAETDIIALDATLRPHPGEVTLDSFFHAIKEKYPHKLLMADCSTVEEALHADALGFDFIGTTLVGYTPNSANDKIESDNFAIIRTILSNVTHPVIAEGNIDTPEKASKVIRLGCYSVVVGSSITRPQLITRKFANSLQTV